MGTKRGEQRTKKLRGMCRLIRLFVDGKEITAREIQDMLRLKSRCEAQNYVDIIGFYFPVYERKQKRQTGARGRHSTIYKLLEPEHRPNGGLNDLTRKSGKNKQSQKTYSPGKNRNS